MLELSFNDIITNLHFAESTVLDKYMKDKSYMMQDLSKISFDSIWDSTLKIVSPFSSNLSNIITTWKKDIFMSIYTALLYESTPSINKTQLSVIKSIIVVIQIPLGRLSLKNSENCVMIFLLIFFFKPCKIKILL